MKNIEEFQRLCVLLFFTAICAVLVLMEISVLFKILHNHITHPLGFMIFQLFCLAGFFISLKRYNNI